MGAAAAFRRRYPGPPAHRADERGDYTASRQRSHRPRRQPRLGPEADDRHVAEGHPRRKTARTVWGLKQAPDVSLGPDLLARLPCQLLPAGLSLRRPCPHLFLLPLGEARQTSVQGRFHRDPRGDTRKENLSVLRTCRSRPSLKFPTTAVGRAKCHFFNSRSLLDVLGSEGLPVEGGNRSVRVAGVKENGRRILGPFTQTPLTTPNS